MPGNEPVPEGTALLRISSRKAKRLLLFVLLGRCLMAASDTVEAVQTDNVTGRAAGATGRRLPSKCDAPPGKDPIMQRRIALTLSGAALVLSGCTGLSTGAYQSDGYGKEPYDAPVYDEGGLYEPGLYDGGIDRNRSTPWPGGDGRIDDRDL